MIAEDTFDYGVVVALEDAGQVRLRFEDGREETFVASDELMQLAASRFRQRVYVKIAYELDSDGGRQTGTLCDLSAAAPCVEESVVKRLLRLRERLLASGVIVDWRWLW